MKKIITILCCLTLFLLTSCSQNNSSSKQLLKKDSSSDTKIVKKHTKKNEDTITNLPIPKNVRTFDEKMAYTGHWIKPANLKVIRSLNGTHKYYTIELMHDGTFNVVNALLDKNGTGLKGYFYSGNEKNTIVKILSTLNLLNTEIQEQLSKSNEYDKVLSIGENKVKLEHDPELGDMKYSLTVTMKRTPEVQHFTANNANNISEFQQIIDEKINSVKINKKVDETYFDNGYLTVMLNYNEKSRDQTNVFNQTTYTGDSLIETFRNNPYIKGISIIVYSNIKFEKFERLDTLDVFFKRSTMLHLSNNKLDNEYPDKFYRNSDTYQMIGGFYKNVNKITLNGLPQNKQLLKYGTDDYNAFYKYIK